MPDAIKYVLTEEEIPRAWYNLGSPRWRHRLRRGS